MEVREASCSQPLMGSETENHLLIYSERVEIGCAPLKNREALASQGCKWISTYLEKRSQERVLSARCQ